MTDTYTLNSNYTSTPAAKAFLAYIQEMVDRAAERGNSHLTLITEKVDFDSKLDSLTKRVEVLEKSA